MLCHAAAVLLLLLSTSPGVSIAAPPPAKPSLAVVSRYSDRLAVDAPPRLGEERLPRNWSNTLGMDLGALASSRSLFILGAAGAAAAWSWSEFDDQQQAVRQSLDGSGLGPALSVGNTYGSGWVIAGGSLSVMATGRIVGNATLRDLGGDLCRAYVYSGVTSGVLKHGVHRRRPSGGDLSFPSGHATSAFSTVPVIWHHLGWPAGLGTAVLAACTGAGRVEENHHYASDVIFGAAIGLVVGGAVVDHRRHADLLEHVTVSRQSVGLTLTF